MVEKDFVTMFTGFRIAVNVDYKPHSSSKRLQSNRLGKQNLTWYFPVYNGINSKSGTLLHHMTTYL